MENNLTLITLDSYVRPAIKEDRANQWVLNGPNNGYYQYIIDRNNGSPTNASINRSYATLAYGKGLGFTNRVTDQSVISWANLQSILRPKELRKIVADYQVFGEMSFQVIENRKGELLSIVHVPKQMVVPAIVDENDEISVYWYSKDWRHYRKIENKPEGFNAWNGAKSGNSIYVGKPYSIGDQYFGSPDYSAGLQYAEMEEEISNMNISSIKNGLSAGYIINIPNGITWQSEQKAEFERQVKKKLTSSSNASNFIISFNGQDVEITVTPFPVNVNVHKQWDFLTKECKSQLMTSHRVISPSLVGLSSTSGFSSVADEMDMSEKQTMKRVIAPKQNFIIECLEEVLVQYGINLSLCFKPLTQEEAVVDEISSDEDNVQKYNKVQEKSSQSLIEANKEELTNNKEQ